MDADLIVASDDVSEVQRTVSADGVARSAAFDPDPSSDVTPRLAVPVALVPIKLP